MKKKKKKKKKTKIRRKIRSVASTAAFCVLLVNDGTLVYFREQRKAEKSNNNEKNI